MINVLVNDLIDFKSQLFGDFSLLGSVDLAHQREEVVTTLRASVGNIQVVKSHILNDLLLLMNITLGNGNILLSLEIVLSCISI